MESSLPLPYDIVEESDWNYSFKTKHGIVYHAYFIDFSIYHPTFDIRDRYDASTQIDDYLLYVSIYLNKNNSKRNVLVQAFYELVKNNLYPIDE